MVYHQAQRQLVGRVALASGVVSANAATVNESAVLFDDLRTINLIRSFVDDCKDAPLEKKRAIIDILTNAQPEQPPRFQIADNVVIADFYIPYLCCSDCPPIAYILPAKPVDVQFDIQPREFLFDDAHNYPFTVDPPVEDINQVANPGPTPLNIFIEEKKLFLQPDMEIKETLKTTLTYKGISVPITIIKPDATFSVSLLEDAAGKVQVQLEAKNKDGDGYEWTVNEIGLPSDPAKPFALVISMDDLKGKIANSKKNIVLIILI